MENLKQFKQVYLASNINERINLKGIGAMLNPWFNGSDCPYLDNIKQIQHLQMDFARVLTNEPNYTNCGNRVFFTFNWNNPFRQTFDILSRTCKHHAKKYHSFYPSNSFDMLNIGTCNH